MRLTWENVGSLSFYSLGGTEVIINNYSSSLNGP